MTNVTATQIEVLGSATDAVHVTTTQIEVLGSAGGLLPSSQSVDVTKLSIEVLAKVDIVAVTGRRVIFWLN